MKRIRSGRAATYVRMSTEGQKYSTDHQRARIHRYASEEGLQIVKEYVDEARSGLDIKRRAGLLSLMTDVQSGQADFETILVYDVSRWGRFQDIDEAAYYEHACRREGVRVIYCAEQFSVDGTPFDALLKSIKRTMAAEYSRELSVKVFDAQCRFIRAGFKQGGHAGYGLRRLAITENGTPRRVLEYGEAKGAVTDRVVIILGPDDEIATVRRVYHLYVDQNMSVPGIVRVLNDERIISEFGRPWTAHMVNSLLTNTKYCGALSYNRRSCKLSRPREDNPPDKWVVNHEAIDPLIPRALFEAAQIERAKRVRRYPPDELLDLLRSCHRRHGRINASIIAADPLLPDPQLFKRAFGSLILAYDAAGLPRSKLHSFVDTKRWMFVLQAKLIADVISLASTAGAMAERVSDWRTVNINGALKISVEVLIRRRPRKGLPNWKMRPRQGADFVIAARACPESRELIDYFLVPTSKLADGPLYLKESNLASFVDMRFASVNAMFGQ